MPILTPQQQTLFQHLSNDRQQNADVLEKRSMRGVKLRVIEKYSEQAQFIYELLQNADDVKATRTRFVLNPTGLLFAHNGTIHFSITAPDAEDIDTQQQRLGHINAITSIGNSNKYEAQIGKFGVGFKAVFQYTNTPEIYDSPFFFKIERFIVPLLLKNDHPNRQPDETLFYFPFDNPQKSPAQAFQAIAAKLNKLNNPLLFLRHLTEMTWISSDGNQGQYTKVVKRIDVKNAPCRAELVQGSPCTPDSSRSHAPVSHFLVFTAQTHTHPFSIAYLTQLSDNGQPTQILYNQTFPAYCFFPTKEPTQLRFIIQAPFLLTDSREGLKHGEAWNRHLIEAIAQLTAESLTIIKELGLLTDDFFNVLPMNESDFPAEHLLRAVYEAVLTQLQSNAALLPTQAGTYTTKENAYLAENPELMHLLSSEQLSQLLNNKPAQWVFPQTTHHNRLLWDYLKHHLINQELTSDKLVRRITKAFIQTQTDEWLIQFYSYLLEKARYLWKHQHNLLKTKPILRLTDNQVVAAYNQVGKIQVYLPTADESEYPTVKRCFVEQDKSLQFLQALGLDKPKAYEEIKYYILPRYQQPGDIAPKVMQTDFNKLMRYFLNCPWQQQADYLKKLTAIPFCRAHYFADNTTARRQPSDIYFQTETLTIYFSHSPQIYFLDNEFYAAFYQKFGKESLTQFFKALGVEDKPRRLKIKATLSAQQRADIHQEHCTYDYYHFSQYTYDYDIEGLDAFLADINPEKSKLLWQFLLKLIEENLGQEIFKGQYNWFFRRERYHEFDAKFLVTLRQTAWLYNNAGNCMKPADIIVQELVTNYDTESYTAKMLLEKLDIQAERLAGFTDEHKARLAFGAEVFKLAKAAGKKPDDMLEKFRRFLARNNSRSHAPAWERIPDAPASRVAEEDAPASRLDDGDAGASRLRSHAGAWERESTWERESVAMPLNAGIEAVVNMYPPKGAIYPHSDVEALAGKRAQLEEQFTQKMNEFNHIEAIKSRIISICKYSIEWFNALLALEYLLSHDNKNTGKETRLKFSKIEKEANSDKMILLKNPSRQIPPSIEDMADLSLQCHCGSETKTLLIEVVNVKELTLRARLKSVADIQQIELDNVHSAVIEINNPLFILEQLKTAFQQLPCAQNDNLQMQLTQAIEFIVGPPGTGKTTYLVKEIVRPLMQKSTKVLVLTPTNKVADVFVKKMMAEIQEETHSEQNGDTQSDQNRLIRFGTTGESEIERAGLLKDKSFDISHLTTCVVVTTVARFFYDGFKNRLLKAYDWDVIVFDEASTIMLAQIVYVLYQQANSHFIIVGDPLQIQPVVAAAEWKAENIYTLVGLNNFQTPNTVPHDFNITQLTTQYRSIPPLGALVSQFSYNGILTHHRQIKDKKPLQTAGLDLTEMTVIKFPVSSIDSLYRSQRLDSGGVYHIYSAIFTVELALYLAKPMHADWKIGIICPYLAQITLVEKMLAAQWAANSPVKIVTGTIHGFQGDEFDMMLVLLNAPPTITPHIFLNNQNILNVAISRAKDYLIFIIPDIDGLEQINRLLTISNENELIKPHVQTFTAAEVETILFNQSNYIQENALITTHQNINVYTKPEKKYEVRCADNAVDILLAF